MRVITLRHFFEDRCVYCCTTKRKKEKRCFENSMTVVLWWSAVVVSCCLSCRVAVGRRDKRPTLFLCADSVAAVHRQEHSTHAHMTMAFGFSLAWPKSFLFSCETNCFYLDIIGHKKLNYSSSSTTYNSSSTTTQGAKLYTPSSGG